MSGEERARHQHEGHGEAYLLAHDTLVEQAKRELPRDHAVDALAELFKLFGDGTRIKILHVLMSGEMCVFDIASLLGMTSSAISHQLKALKTAGLVRARRDGKAMLYAPADAHVRLIIQTGMEHVLEEQGAGRVSTDTE